MTQRRLRLLLAEGSPGEAARALHALYARNDPGLDLTVVSTVATLLATIKVVDPEVIFLDLSLNLREPMDAVHLVHRTAPETIKRARHGDRSTWALALARGPRKTSAPSPNSPTASKPYCG
jgi:hypothetical protein